MGSTSSSLKNNNKRIEYNSRYKLDNSDSLEYINTLYNMYEWRGGDFNKYFLDNRYLINLGPNPKLFADGLIIPLKQIQRPALFRNHICENLLNYENLFNNDCNYENHLEYNCLHKVSKYYISDYIGNRNKYTFVDRYLVVIISKKNLHQKHKKNGIKYQVLLYKDNTERNITVKWFGFDYYSFITSSYIFPNIIPSHSMQKKYL